MYEEVDGNLIWSFVAQGARGKEEKEQREKREEKHRGMYLFITQSVMRRHTCRERERDEESEQREVWRAPVAPHSLYQALCFAVDQMSSWHSLAGYRWYGSYGSWYGRRRGSWGGKSEVRSDVEWFCHKCGTGNWWSRTDCRHCASVTERRRGYSRSRQLRRKLLFWRRRWLVWATTSLSWLPRKFLEKELEKLQKKLNGPKKTAKHIEAKQNWTNRESKRLEAETARLTELQESLRVRKETLKVAYEEIKILREDLLREGETMDKNKSHFLSPEETEEIRRLEQQELAFWRGSASKRLAGWTRDGSSEEIAGWMLEAQRLNREVEAKKRKLQETIERESRKDARMGDDAMDGLDGSLSS